MTKRSVGYQYDLLRQLFYASKDDEGKWRLYHAIEKRSQDGRGTTKRRGDLADTTIGSRGYRICSLPRSMGIKRLLVAPIIWCLFHHKDVPDDMLVDHISRNRLDNDPEHNLRLVNAQVSAVNRGPSDGGLIGIFENKHISTGYKRWQAVATNPITKRRVSLKCHLTPESAARAYDEYVLKMYGPGAATNQSLGRL